MFRTTITLRSNAAHYIDESGFQSESTRSYSYSRKGARAEGEFNWQLKNCSNAIGALIENRLLTVGVFDSSVNTEVFECWIEQDLLPKLKETSVLWIMRPFIKGKGFRSWYAVQAITLCGFLNIART